MTEENEPALTVTVDSDERSFRITVGGELDLHTAPRVQQVLDRVYDAPPGELVLDFRHLYFIDSAGLAMLVDVYRRLNKSSVLTLRVSPEGQVRQVLELSRFDRFFQIDSSHQDQPAE